MNVFYKITFYINCYRHPQQLALDVHCKYVWKGTSMVVGPMLLMLSMRDSVDNAGVRYLYSTLAFVWKCSPVKFHVGYLFNLSL